MMRGIMLNIQLKRVYEPAHPSDGFRILTDRLWPRGVKKEVLQYDFWAKTVAPSNDLRKWVHADKASRWEEFVTRYEKELVQEGAWEKFVSDIKTHTTVTLLFASKDEEHNHAVILQKLLLQALSNQIL